MTRDQALLRLSAIALKVETGNGGEGFPSTRLSYRETAMRSRAIRVWVVHGSSGFRACFFAPSTEAWWGWAGAERVRGDGWFRMLDFLGVASVR